MGEAISAAALVLAASKSGGGSGEPSEYLKNATTSGNTLTLTKKDNTTVTFTPTTDLSAYRTAANQDIIDNGKQDTISDLSTIRSGAALGATALQSVPSEYVTQTELEAYHDSTKQNTLTAGSNITIENDVISATGSGGTAWGQITGDMFDQEDLAETFTGILEVVDEKSNKLVAGTNVTLGIDEDAKVVVNATDTTYQNATTTTAGLESAADKTKLDSLVPVSGTNDGTNWTSLTIDGTTKNIPAGGGSSYTFTNGLTESSGTVSWDLNDKINNYNSNIGIGALAKVDSEDNGSYSVKLGCLSDTYHSKTRARSEGNVIMGYASDDGIINMTAEGSGAIIMGFAKNGGNTPYQAAMQSMGRGSLVQGCSEAANGMQANAAGSHCEGYSNVSGGMVANAIGSHCEGYCTQALSPYQHTAGKFNIRDNNSTYAYIIGNGTSNNARSNAFTVAWTGDVNCAGAVTATNIPAPPSTDGTYQLTCTITSGVPTYSWVAGGSQLTPAEGSSF